MMIQHQGNAEMPKKPSASDPGEHPLALRQRIMAEIRAR